MKVIWRSRPLLCSVRLPRALTRVCTQWALNEKERDHYKENKMRRDSDAHGKCRGTHPWNSLKDGGDQA